MESLIEIDRTTGSVYLLRDLIQERLGLALDDHRGISLIINRLAGRMQQSHCRSFLEYYYLLMSDGTAANDEWRYVMAALAKSFSSFWRHTSPVRALVEIALPQLLARARPEPLRIWSASCATGEEPLAIAMALKEAGWFERATIEIYASDASHTAIESAVRGVYSEARICQLDIHLRDKYFTRKSAGWQVLPELHHLIQWRVANLMNDPEVVDLAQSHVIFCRNALIYFTGHALCKTLYLFARFMPAGAYLFADDGEFFTNLVAYSKLFEPLRINGSAIWIRQDRPACDQ